MDKITSAAASARASWLCGDTVADRKWALRQLHGLADLLQENRDGILAQFAKDSGQGSQICEREFAILLIDLAAHIKEANEANAEKFTMTSYTASQPRGVCLIIDETDNAFRYALAPFAAAIASANTAVLASAARSCTLELIREKAPSYLDCLALHIVHGVGSGDLGNIDDLVDSITICSRDHTKWSTLLASPKAHHVSNSHSCNLAVLPEGKVDVYAAVKNVLENANAGVRPYDGVDALLVHQSLFEAVSQAVAKSSVSIGDGKPIERVPTGCIELRPGVLSLDLGSGCPHVASGTLEQLLSPDRQVRALTIVSVFSLQQIIHLTKQMTCLSQIAILGSAHKKVVDYLRSATASDVFSIGSIPNTIPSTSHWFPLSSTLFSSSFFTKRRAVHVNRQWPTLHLVEDMRRAYQGVIPKLAPEPPGGRIDFFVQVEYAIKTLGVAVGVCSIAGAYYGVKFLRHRLM